MIFSTIFIDNFAINNSDFSFNFRKDLRYNPNQEYEENLPYKLLNFEVDFLEKIMEKPQENIDQLPLRLFEENRPNLLIYLSGFLIKSITKCSGGFPYNDVWYIEGKLTEKGLNIYSDKCLDFVKV